MGLTIAGNVEIRALYGSVGNIIAFSKANISKGLLGWLDLNELITKYPNKVAINGSMVSFSGPVAIIQSVTTIKASLVGLSAIVGGGLIYSASYGILTLLSNKISACKQSNEQIHKKSLIIAAVGGLAVAAICFFYALPLLPTKPGVYFFFR